MQSFAISFADSLKIFLDKNLAKDNFAYFDCNHETPKSILLETIKRFYTYSIYLSVIMLYILYVMFMRYVGCIILSILKIMYKQYNM